MDPPQQHGDPAEAELSSRESVLIVDDDDDLRRLLERLLEAAPAREITTASRASEAREHLRARTFDVVVTDISMPGEDGISLMRWAQEHHPGPIWIVLTGHGTLDVAVEALQLGAFDFVSKPVQPASMRNVLNNAIAQGRLVRERDRLTDEVARRNAELSERVAQLDEACRLLEEQADVLRTDLRRAALIQHSQLPSEAPALANFHVHAAYRPSESVGGDVYDLIELEDGHVCLVIADSAGHGLSAAMLAVMFRNQLRMLGRAPRDPSEVLQHLNSSLCNRFTAPGLFITAALCLLNTETGALSSCSAGHPPLLLQRAGGEIERIFHSGPALGLYADAAFGQHETRLRPGDRLLLHTDGLFDNMPPGTRSPSDQLVAGLQTSANKDAEAVIAELLERCCPAGSNDAQSDDVTLLMLVAAPGSSRLDNGLPMPLSKARPAGSAKAAEMLVGHESTRTTIAVLGRADWASSASFHDRCLSMLRDGHPLMLDLTLCEYMDSTFLGTIHELTERFEAADVEFRLQGVTPPIEDLFEELGMALVRDHVVPTMLPLPTHMSSLLGEGDSRTDAQGRILDAHEALARLSTRNRREFDPLLALLRQDEAALDPTGRPPD